MLHSLVIGGTSQSLIIHLHTRYEVGQIVCIFYRLGCDTGRLVSDSPRVTQEVTGRAGTGTLSLIPTPVLGLLGYTTV